MVSLTTVYIVSVILTSLAGMGSAFAGNKMIGGALEPTEEIVQPTEEIQQPTEEIVPQESPQPSTEQIQPEESSVPQ